MTRRWTALLLPLVVLGACGGRPTRSTSLPLGRSLGVEHTRAGQAPAPTGDPSEERNGMVPQAQAESELKPSPGSLARSPEAALIRYARAYTNWQASRLGSHERELASLAVGSARLTAEQTAASQSIVATLAANHVKNEGTVLAIAPGLGTARGQWIVVTYEQTTGTGPYAGLPALAHVTFARAAHVGRGWVVSQWRPTS